MKSNDPEIKNPAHSPATQMHGESFALLERLRAYRRSRVVFVLTYKAEFCREHQSHSYREADEVVTHQAGHGAKHLLPGSPDDASRHRLWR